MFNEEFIEDKSYSIRMKIPRDVNSSIIMENVTEVNESFSIKMINLTELKSSDESTFSIHFQIYANRSYLFLYQFNDDLKMNSEDNFILLCPTSSFFKSDSFIYEFHLVSSHERLIYALRQLHSSETCSFNQISIFNHQNELPWNYFMRIYLSACYYLDENNQWKSNGLKVKNFVEENKKKNV